MNVYETMILKAHRPAVEKAFAYFQEARILGGDKLVKITDKIWAIAPDNTTVPQWNHTILVPEKGSTPANPQLLAFIDLRPHTRPDGAVRNKVERDLAIQRAMLELVWANNKPEYQAIADGLSMVFAEWVFSAVRRRFGNATAIQDGNYIRFLERTRIVYVTYYWLLFLTTRELETASRDMLLGQVIRFITRNLRYPTEFVQETISMEAFGLFLDRCIANRGTSFADMCDAINGMGAGAGFRAEASLYQQLLIDGSWFGFSAKEIAIGALEHPPFMAHMIGLTNTVGVYRRTGIGSAVDSVKRTRANVVNVDNWMRLAQEEYGLLGE